jgi:hypothetical protein
MKRAAILIFVFLVLALVVNASELLFDDLTEAQRYDLADAYDRVADRFEELDDIERADSYRIMVQLIFPGYGQVERPSSPVEPVQTQRPAQPAPDPAGGDASFYYFNKILRGVFNENVSLTISAIADTLYLPLFDAGVDKAMIASELEWFFSEYDITSVSPDDIFRMTSMQVLPLDNGFWRLDIQTWPEYADAIPEVTFWAEKMGFYFRKFPEGWRLAAIGPVA